jgi:hypothetical protein
MAEAYFSVKSRGVLRVRLEPSEIFGTGSPVLPTLTLQLKLQLGGFCSTPRKGSIQKKHCKI